jgi:glycosyltransferase involved in cell wall biosynthesis
MIRVAIDARRMQDDPPSGTGRWMANLIPHLRAEFELVLLTDRRRPSPGIEGVEEVRLGPRRSLPEPFWLHASAARWLRPFDGVFHGTYNALPFSYRGPSVLTLHDLSWADEAADFARGKRLAFSVQARWSAPRATVVQTVSDFSRAAIARAYGLDPDRIVLAPPAVDPIFSPTRALDLDPLRTRLGIFGPYLVALGGTPRRQLDVAVGAWQRLGPGAPTLVVVGTETPPRVPGLVDAGRLSDADWSSLLAGAAAFCYPTRYEGFGMPALEAAASGTPVVCARIGPLDEVLGDAAEWCARPDIEQIAAGLDHLLHDEARRGELVARALARAESAHSWERSAASLAQAYRSAATGPRRRRSASTR